MNKETEFKEKSTEFLGLSKKYLSTAIIRELGKINYPNTNYSDKDIARKKRLAKDLSKNYRKFFTEYSDLNFELIRSI